MGTKMKTVSGLFNRPGSRYFLLAISSLLVVTTFSSLQSYGQNDEGDDGKPDVEASEPVDDHGSSDAPKLEQDEVKEPEPGIMARIDGGFASAVDWMAGVLFYRVGSHSETYVQMNHEEHYIRDHGSSGAFEKLDPDGTYDADSISNTEAIALDARGLLANGSKDADGKPQIFRLGSVGNRKVEFISVIMDVKSKYVGVKNAKSDIEYHKVLPMRSLLSDDEILKKEDVNTLVAQGRLKTDDNGNHILSQKSGGAPVVVLWLALGSVFFTIYMRGVNVWGFRHAVEIVRGKYDNPNEPGEVSHFQALSSALSATVGLGNIAGVTIAMTVGGPGAFFWMLMCGVLGMTSKFVECTLGQKYRRVKEDGTVLGGPMQYLHEGLKELGLGPIGLVLSIVFAVMCIMASFGGGNMFQANQSGAAMVSMIQKGNINKVEELDNQIKASAEAEDFDKLASLQTEKKTLQESMASTASIIKVVFGLILAAAVGIVILGGIKRIAAAAEKIVPSMCLMYVAACLWIILMHIPEVPALIGQIFSEAFSGKAFGGGMIGVLVIGVQRAAFSNEAGVGSASIAHSAAKTEEPVREGAVALLGPFIDTIVVCSMTALVILITGAWSNEQWIVDQGLAGSQLTSKAFENEISWFPYVLAVAVVLFAYSTMISWSYYGERCWERLFGAGSTILYRILYVIAVFVGTIVNLGAVLDFSDMMILSMAFPNIFGLLLLSPKIRADLLDYWHRYKSGEFKTYK